MKAWVLIAGLAATGLSVQLFAADKPAEKPKAGSNSQKSTPAQTKAGEDYPVIVYLERRGQTIAIKAGPKGPLYSIKTAEGKILFENLSAEQLRAQAPEVHDFLKTSMAKSGKKSDGFLDARIEMRQR